MITGGVINVGIVVTWPETVRLLRQRAKGGQRSLQPKPSRCSPRILHRPL